MNDNIQDFESSETETAGASTRSAHSDSSERLPNFNNIGDISQFLKEFFENTEGDPCATEAEFYTEEQKRQAFTAISKIV